MNRIIRNVHRMCVLLLALCGTHTYAADEPKPGKYDSRIRTVTYNEQDVVRIISYIGFSTTIFFEKGEEVAQMDLGDGKARDYMILGNTEAWSTVWYENTLTIKPKVQRGEKANTSMLVRTNRRLYTFSLELGEKAGEIDSTIARGMMFKVYFAYKKDDATLTKPPTPTRNYRYSAVGSPTDFPYEMWDDTLKTYMRFYQQQSLPSVFEVDPATDKDISMIEKHVEGGGTLVLHGVFRKVRLRYGNGSVVCIEKDDPLDRTVPPPSGTTVPGLVRERR